MKTFDQFKPETQNAIKLFRENFWKKINEFNKFDLKDVWYLSEVGYYSNDKEYADANDYQHRLAGLISGTSIGIFLLFNNFAINEIKEAILFLFEKNFFHD